MSNVAFNKLKEELCLVDEAIDKGVGTEEVVNKRVEVLNSMRYIDQMHAMDLAQKAKIKWSIEGDENSSFFHGMLNKKHNQSNIRGIMVDGVWKDQPNDVKREFLNHFQERFDKPVERRVTIDMSYPRSISDKSPGPDGFTFDFYRQFWSTIEKDVLINVLGDIVSEVQSAFVAGRQMLDGPFILNEVLHWCSKKKQKSLIFKVDFEKAYDSVRWDFLDDVLKKFGFGLKINLCKSSIPIFHMSLFRVPSRVLQILESIRGRFFNGYEIGSKKVSWVKWNNVLTDKKRGGLGVSSLYALNRGLMIKWLWKFFVHKDSLWTKVITAIHGVNGNVSSSGAKAGRSCWLAIVDEVRALHKKGVYVFDFMNLKLGNGEMVKFWLDRWYEGGILKDLFPRMFALENMKEITVSSKLNGE
ncbi:RNA-directed DNA polymerase, eukaryota, reverse transcriptase zinc-binding domain protein [Tanacetum coccineum]